MLLQQLMSLHLEHNPLESRIGWYSLPQILRVLSFSVDLGTKSMQSEPGKWRMNHQKPTNTVTFDEIGLGNSPKQQLIVYKHLKPFPETTNLNFVALIITVFITVVQM